MKHTGKVQQERCTKKQVQHETYRKGASNNIRFEGLGRHGVIQCLKMDSGKQEVSKPTLALHQYSQGISTPLSWFSDGIVRQIKAHIQTAIRFK